MNVFLLMVALASPVEAPKAGVPAVAAADAAAAAVVTVVGEVAPTSAAVCAETVVGEIAPMSAAVPSAGGVLPSAASAAGCALADLFKGDFLTGPWGAAWRLEAARKRGDSAAARRLETTLDALLVDAVSGGEM